MRDQRVERACEDYRAGRITLLEFTKATRDTWRRLARSLIRRWRPPRWLGPEDVEQELLVAAESWVWRYGTRGTGWLESRSKSTTIGAFVVWSAVVDAKYAIHEARGVSLHGNPDKEQTPLAAKARPLSSYVREGEEEGDRHTEAMMAAAGAVNAANQDEWIDLVERLQTLRRACRTPREVASVGAVAASGSIVGACERIRASEAIAEFQGGGLDELFGEPLPVTVARDLARVGARLEVEQAAE